MRSRSALLITTVCSLLLAAGSWAEPKTPPKSEPEEEAVFTFSGKRGKPVKIIDHRTDDVTTHESYVFVNQSTEQAIAASEARREAARDTVLAIEAERAAEAEAAAAATDTEEAAPGAPQELPVDQGLQLLRQNNFVTFSSDNRRYPAQVYNEVTKQFVPTAEALKSVQQPAQPAPATTTQSNAAPPRARVVDPTP